MQRDNTTIRQVYDARFDVEDHFSRKSLRELKTLGADLEMNVLVPVG